MTESTSPSILVVDDTQANLRLLVEILTGQGYVVRPTSDAHFAIASALAEPPDLILLDIVMPHITGYEVCQVLRADDRTRDVPVIYLSALAEVQDKLRALDVGGVDYITKPLQTAEVLSRVETHLAFKRLRDSLQERNLQLAQENAERRQSEQVLQRYNERLEIQHEIEQSILAARLPETIALAAISRIRRLIPFRHAIVLAVGETDQLEMLAAESYGDIEPPLAASNYYEVLQEQVLKRGLIQGVEDLASSSRRSHLERMLFDAGMRSYIIAPLFILNELIGTFHLESDQAHAFTQEHIAIATEVAASLAVAIREARLYEQSQREVAERRRSERQLRQQKELLESTIESLTHPFYVINVRDYAVEIANAAGGNRDHGSEALTCYALSHHRDQPCDGTEHPCPLQQVVRTREPVMMEHIHYDENGNLQNVEVHGYPVFEPDGQILRVIEYSLDITERKRIEQASKEAVAAAERERLSRDLHDAVTQTLFSASLIAEVLPQLWERDPVEAERNLAKLRQLTRGALAEMRTLLLELRPTALTERPLGELLRHLAEALANRTKIPVEVMVDQGCAVPPEVQVAQYRIAQEALNNVAKHAGASQATLTLRCSQQRIELCIEDDGGGFDANTIPPGHLGVGIMRERAEGIGASFEVDSEPGQGTRIRVIWNGSKDERTSR